jgi:hypothetical protein
MESVGSGRLLPTYVARRCDGRARGNPTSNEGARVAQRDQPGGLRWLTTYIVPHSTT